MTIISAGGAVTGAGEVPFNPREYFNTVLYTGNGSTQTITGVGFQPDWTWVKGRSVAQGNSSYDVLRGYDFKVLSSDSNSAQVTETGGVSAVASDGFSLNGNNTIIGGSNSNGQTYVAWNWKANGAGVSNTAGTISSTVSANTDAGFSIITYTGTEVNATVGHGLGVAPKMVIVKRRNTTGSWGIYHSNLTSAAYFVRFNSTNAEAEAPEVWNSTAPTSSVFSIGTDSALNFSGSTYVAYCFAEVEGFSKFGSYTGNGSATGPSVTTGFQPTFLMIKRTDSTGDWIIYDSARDATNPRTAFLEWNTSDAEESGLDVDFNSTSFQMKSSSATVNASGGTYIYMCIA
jgi:hypothetical protein